MLPNTPSAFTVLISLEISHTLLLRTNLLETDTIHLHHDIYASEINSEKAFQRSSKRALNLSRLSPVFLVETLNETVLTQSSQTYI